MRRPPLLPRPGVTGSVWRAMRSRRMRAARSEETSTSMGKSDSRQWRGIVARVAASTGITRLHERQAASAVTVLMYHKILPQDEAARYALKNLVVHDDVFREQVAWLARHTRCLTMRDALAATAGGNDLRSRGDGGDQRPIVVLTFDDGYLDNYELAAPVLDAHGVPATFYLTTSFVQGQPLWHDRASVLFTTVPREVLQEAVRNRFRDAEPAGRPVADQRLDAWMGSLKRIGKPARDSALASVEEAHPVAEVLQSWRYRPMSVEQAVDLHRRGHEIASHTVTHPILPELDRSAQLHELADSRTLIEGWIGAPVHGICYPNGDCNQHTLEAAREAGYTYGCVTERGRFVPGRDDCFRVRRRMISQGNSTDGRDRLSPAVLRAEIAGVYQTVKRLRP